MAKIGYFGSLITFRTSDKKILNFLDFNQTVTGRWADHEIIGKKPKSEFLGPGLRQLSFKIELNAMNGVKPRKIIGQIESAVEKGTVAYMAIGGKKVGKYKWRITKLDESWDYILNKGEVVKATTTWTLEEYVPPAKKKKKTKSKTTKKKYKTGQIVNFKGGMQYTSNKSKTGRKVRAGKAKIKIICKSKAHPYFLVHTDKKSNVNGWVNNGTFK
nr:MAG TPA: hypothetical protein [Caudoviricetes sp.]